MERALEQARCAARVGEVPVGAVVYRGDELLAEAQELERSLDIPLLLRLATLRACGRERAADRLVQGIASRLQPASWRRRFLAFGKRVRV